MTQSTTGLVELKALAAKATPGPWRLGADLCRVHPYWKDDDGNAANEGFHRNGFAKTIATVAKENGDWRGIEQAVADGHLIAAVPDMITLLSTQETTIAELVADAALWKRLAAERSEQMIDLNLDRAAMGVEISRLQEIVARYGDRIAMANAPAEMQQTIDEALAAGLPPTKSRSAL